MLPESTVEQHGNASRWIGSLALLGLVVLGLCAWKVASTGHPEDSSLTWPDRRRTTFPGDASTPESSRPRFPVASIAANSSPQTSAEQADLATTAEPGSTEAANASSEQELQQLVLGNWEDDYRGKRRMTLSADGTGTMWVEPPGIGKKLLAPLLEFNLTWHIADKKLHMHTLGGTPANKVRMVLRLYGDHQAQPIVSVTESMMHLLDEDGETEYHWRRATSDVGFEKVSHESFAAPESEE